MCFNCIHRSCLIVLQWQREAGQLVLYRGIRCDDVIGRGTWLTSLGITRHFSYSDPYIFCINFFFFFNATYTSLLNTIYFIDFILVFIYVKQCMFKIQKYFFFY